MDSMQLIAFIKSESSIEAQKNNLMIKGLHCQHLFRIILYKKIILNQIFPIELQCFKILVNNYKYNTL